MTKTLEGLVRYNEGVRTSAYDDATGQDLRPGDTLVGNLTIGVGHNMTAGGVSMQTVTKILQEDLVGVHRGIKRLLGNDAPPEDTARYAALGDLVFNMGTAKVARFKGMLAAVRRGDWIRASHEILYRDPDADKPVETPYARRLPARARRNAAMLRTGRWPAAY